MMDLNSFIAVSGDQSQNTNILGQLLYMSLGSMLINRDKMTEIFESLGLPEKLMPKRLQYVDAFNSATGDIATKFFVNNKLIKLYVRDNLRDKNGKILSRELVKETVGADNNYKQLGKFTFDLEAKTMSSEITDYDSDVDSSTLQEMQAKVEKLFELYKVSYNRNSIETIFENLLSTLDTSKVAVYGKLYFVPRYKMDKVVMIEEFAEKLNQENMLKNLGINCSNITINSIFVINDEKQRKAFEQEFYNTVEKEIEYYQERLQHFLENGCSSSNIINRWIQKIDSLKNKKKNYEEVFNKSLNKLSDQFDIINTQVSELKIRLMQNSYGTGNQKSGASGTGGDINGQVKLSCLYATA